MRRGVDPEDPTKVIGVEMRDLPGFQQTHDYVPGWKAHFHAGCFPDGDPGWKRDDGE